MYDGILVPTDGSPGAEAALERALEFASADAAVHALYVVAAGDEPAGLAADERAGLREAARERGRRAAGRVRDRAEDRGFEAVRAVREGAPYRAILEYASEHDVDLVVMGTHGRTGPSRTRLGSTTERVVALADVPVLTVRLGEGAERRAPGDRTYDRIVVPTDGSGAAGRAAEHGVAVAERYGADVHAVYVVDATTYGLGDAPRSIIGLLKEGGRNAVGEVAAAARDRNLSASTAILRGVPAEAILQYAAGADADLLVMGTRGRTPAEDRLLGSTTARVVRRSERPVLTVS